MDTDLRIIVQEDLVSNILISLFKYDSLGQKNWIRNKKKEIPENIFSWSPHNSGGNKMDSRLYNFSFYRLGGVDEINERRI